MKGWMWLSLVLDELQTAAADLQGTAPAHVQQPLKDTLNSAQALQSAIASPAPKAQ